MLEVTGLNEFIKLIEFIEFIDVCNRVIWLFGRRWVVRKM